MPVRRQPNVEGERYRLGCGTIETKKRDEFGLLFDSCVVCGVGGVLMG